MLISELYSDVLIYIFDSLPLYKPILKLVCKRWNQLLHGDNIFCTETSFPNHIYNPTTVSFKKWVHLIIKNSPGLVLWLGEYIKLSQNDLLKAIKYCAASSNYASLNNIVKKLKHEKSDSHELDKLEENISASLLCGQSRAGDVNRLIKEIQIINTNLRRRSINKAIVNVISGGSVNTINTLFNYNPSYLEYYIINNIDTLIKKCCHNHRLDMLFYLSEKIKSFDTSPKLKIFEKVVRLIILLSIKFDFRLGYHKGLELFNLHGEICNWDHNYLPDLSIIACYNNNIKMLREIDSKIKLDYNIVLSRTLRGDIGYSSIYFNIRSSADDKYLKPEIIHFMLNRGMDGQLFMERAIDEHNYLLCKILHSCGINVNFVHLSRIIRRILHFCNKRVGCCDCSYCNFLLFLIKKCGVNPYLMLDYYLPNNHNFISSKLYYITLLKFLSINRLIDIKKVNGLFLYTRLYDYIYYNKTFPYDIFDESIQYIYYDDYDDYYDYEYVDNDTNNEVDPQELKLDVDESLSKSKLNSNKRKQKRKLYENKIKIKPKGKLKRKNNNKYNKKTVYD